MMSIVERVGNSERPEATQGGDNLTPVQYQAVIALLEYPTVKEAAEATEVHKATIYKWLQDRDFQAVYREARREVFAATVSRLQQVSSEAVETLREVMVDKKQQGAARVGAARVVLDYAVKVVEQQEMIERIERLEAQS